MTPLYLFERILSDILVLLVDESLLSNLVGDLANSDDLSLLFKNVRAVYKWFGASIISAPNAYWTVNFFEDLAKFLTINVQ